MGLESRPIAFPLSNATFAPCMGLERTEPNDVPS